MSVAFLSLELPRWDEAQVDGLIVSVFADERPLRGAAGLCDWRLAGRLSRLIQRGRVSGAEGESLLTLPGRRLPFKRLLMVGLGRQSRFNDDIYRRQVRWIRDVARRAGMKDFAIQPPGRATGLVTPRRALEMWLEEPAVDDERTLIIDSAAGHKEMAEILPRERPARGSQPPETPRA